MSETLVIKIKRKPRLGPEAALGLRRYKVLKSKKKEESKRSCRKFKHRRNDGD